MPTNTHNDKLAKNNNNNNSDTEIPTTTNKGSDANAKKLLQLFEKAKNAKKLAEKFKKVVDKKPTLVETDKNSGTSDDSNDKKDVSSLRLVFLGGGSFGTAMANLAARNGCDTTLWVRNKRDVKYMQKHHVNKKYLPKHKLDERLQYSSDLKTAVQDKDIIFMAVPSSAFRETLKKIAPYITGQSVVSLTKGMEKESYALMSEIIEEELPEVNFGVMSGPNLAVEVMANMPSASVIASNSEQLRYAVQSSLHSAFFRVFASDDIKGVELGGALKNIYAIAMGMASAYNVGDNTKAMLLTRSLAEMSRFGQAVGANPLTFLGLAGVGDLYATCNSQLSRNFRVGKMLGEGVSLEQAIKKLGQTAEGVNTIQQVHAMAKRENVYMPITHSMYAILFEDKTFFHVAAELLETGFRSDVEFVMPHDTTNSELNEIIHNR